MEKSNNSASKPEPEEVKMPVQEALPQVPDLSQPDDAVIGSAHQAFEDQARRSDYEGFEHLSGYEIINHNLTRP